MDKIDQSEPRSGTVSHNKLSPVAREYLNLKMKDSSNTKALNLSSRLRSDLFSGMGGAMDHQRSSRTPTRNKESQNSLVHNTSDISSTSRHRELKSRKGSYSKIRN